MQTNDWDRAAAVHQYFLQSAATFSPDLVRDLRRIRPLSVPRRRSRVLLTFLGRVVVGQQLSTFAARSIWNRIKEVAGERGLLLEDVLHPRFGTRLRKCGVSPNKVRAICAIRKAIDEGAIAERAIARITHTERSQLLLNVWGIGPWTCDMTGIFFFKDVNVWPSGDVAVTRTFMRYAGKGRSWNARHDALVSRFAPHRSLLALYMYRIADSEFDFDA